MSSLLLRRDHIRHWLPATALLGLTIAVPLSAQPTVYQHTETDGSVTYSDNPGAEAEAVDLPPLPVVETPETAAASQAADAANTAGPTLPVLSYQSLRVASPAPDSVVRSNGGQVAVVLELQPPLRADLGHAILLRLDGQLQPQWPETALSGTLSNVSRGLHQVSATVVDARGQPLTQSAPASFRLLRVAAGS